jgi:hypothetical protein
MAEIPDKKDALESRATSLITCSNPPVNAIVPAPMFKNLTFAAIGALTEL